MNEGAQMEEMIAWFTERLPRFLPDHAPPKLYEAMRYSLMAGGKRVRPILLFAVLESLGKQREIGLQTAAAIEMIHTYSLIHDDLPAMDNDDYRRGKLTNHKVFGEGMAILAGDALLTWAFHLMGRLTENPEVSEKTALTLVRELGRAAGPTGMVAGQVLDMEAEHHPLSIDEVEKIHLHKTGEMIRFSVFAGALLAEAGEQILRDFSTFARKLGLAFQVQDDILNVIGDAHKMGKRVGSDSARGKNTYPALMGIEESKRYLKELVEEGKSAISSAPIDHHFLYYLADYIVKRDR